MASDLFAKYSCTYCLDDIVGIRVKCVECTDFDLCLQCFSAGAEIGPHKNDHSYQFVDPGAIEIFRSKNKWTAREELQLLNGIEQYGFGNWEEISQHIKTRTAEEAKEEYMSRYVEGSIGRCTWRPAYERRAKLKDLGADLPPEGSSSCVEPIDVTPEEATQLGYMPQRGDFEREYENEAESLVSRLNTSSTDEDELDIVLKLVHVDMYMDKLRERAHRKKVVRDYQLISKFFAERKDRHSRRKTNLEQEVEEKLKCFCTFHSPEHHESLVRSMQRQRELEHRLSELFRYRRAGLTRMEEVAHYEQELARSRGSGSSWEHSHQTEPKRKKGEDGEESTPCSTTRNSMHPTGSHSSSPEPEQLQQPMQYIVIREPSHLLSSTEAQLCTSLELTPSQFISMKTFFLLNPQEETGTTAEKVIQDHIKSNGWFTSTV